MREGREERMTTDRQRLLADLEALAAAELKEWAGRLRQARQDGNESEVTRARLDLLEALELWERAHDARRSLRYDSEWEEGGAEA
jgi:hypothetical protein